MPRPRTGSVFVHGASIGTGKNKRPKPDGASHFDIQITGPNGERSNRMCMPVGMARPAARAKAKAWTEDAKAGRLVFDASTPAMPPGEAGETFETWAERWCEAREARGLTSVDDDRGRLKKWVTPTLGPKPIASITRSDLEGLVEALDEAVRAEKLAAKTAQNVWGLVSKAFDDAKNAKARALRAREDNPAADVRGPDDGPTKAKQGLYPSEFSALAACELVPLHWRHLFTVAIYLCARAAEVRGLEWPDVDLEHAVVHFHRAVDDKWKETTLKNEEARRVPIEPALLPLLELLHREAGGVGRVMPWMPNEEDQAEALRKWLLRAGVKREELHTTDKTRRRLRFHDLRATGITWRCVRGDDPLKVMRAAGHKDFGTTTKYLRDADQLRAGFGDPFPALPTNLLRPARIAPGIAPGDGGDQKPKRSRVVTWRSQRELNTGRNAENAAKQGDSRPTADPEPTRIDVPSTRTDVARSDSGAIRVDAEGAPASVPAAAPEPSQGDLEKALAGAVAAGRWALAESLAELLKGRQRDAAGVVDLDAERAKRRP